MPATPDAASTATSQTMSREQAVLCPALGAIIAEGGIPLDDKGDFTLKAMHDYLVDSMNVSEGFAGLCMGLGPFSNTLRDVLGNILSAHVNALDLRQGMAQHPGDSGVLRPGQFDEARFDALVGHGQDLVRENGKIVDGVMRLQDVARAILENVKRDGTTLAYTKGLPTSMFEFGSLINILGTRDPATQERIVSIRVMRDLYEHKQLPPKSVMQGRARTGIPELTETMAQMAAAMPQPAGATKAEGFAHQALNQAFHEVSGAIHTVMGRFRHGASSHPSEPTRPAPTAASSPATPTTAAPRVAFTPPQSIEQVLADLNALVDDAIRSKGRIGYFAGLYECVTATIRRAVVAGLFDDNVRMARLDVIFATRFLEAWSTYQAGGTPTQSYRLAFDALADDRLMVVQHQLLALNAHIFLDLGIACATVAPGPLLPTLHNDFLKINDILKRFISMVEIKVGQISQVTGKIEVLASGPAQTIIGFSLLEARDLAWAFATQLAAAPADAWPALIANQDATTARLGHIIQNPGEPLRAGLALLHATESRDIASNIIIVSE
jgi:hypothetical protein